MMIDLHSHILPGIDDGAGNLDEALDMARMWVADGVGTVACTPHILPGMYHNTGAQIRSAVAALQSAVTAAGIPLRLIAGADAHIVQDFVPGLQSGHILTLNDTRYVLVEPPHHVLPPRMDHFFFSIQMAGYVPILTHPERLGWLADNYDLVRSLHHAGVLMQITSGSFLGSFGRKPKYWAERMLADGLANLIASDAHNVVKRPPSMRLGYEAVAQFAGEKEAKRLCQDIPGAILDNIAPSELPGPHVSGDVAVAVSAGATPENSRQARHARNHEGAQDARDNPRRTGSLSLLGRLRRIFGA